VTESRTLWWDDALGGIRYIEQTLLPSEYTIIDCTSVDRLATAIRRLEIRGAPALGVAGAFGVALAARSCAAKTFPEFCALVEKDRHKPGMGYRPGHGADDPKKGHCVSPKSRS